jgi:hypothetical protein
MSPRDHFLVALDTEDPALTRETPMVRTTGINRANLRVYMRL